MPDKPSTITLSAEEIVAITGYRMPTMQLEKLHKDGFYRARMGRHGVTLTREHFNAVEGGRDAAPVKKSINLAHLKLA